MNKSLLRDIPKVDDLIRSSALAYLFEDMPRATAIEAIREELEALRRAVLSGDIEAMPSQKSIIENAYERAKLKARPSLRGVINGTGVVLHTNLGRACIPAEAVAAIVNAARGYSTLEYDVASGSRGERYSHIEKLLCSLTGAESAMAVNNNAAAVLLVLSALTSGGEVIVSRGELVEIGGSFRVPEIMESCGAKLKEVGTTNKTHISDYENAITEQTRAIMKVHTSNYRIVGFTETVSRQAMAETAHKNGLVFIEVVQTAFEELEKDFTGNATGSGSLVDLNLFGIREEPTVLDPVRAGADVVSFSGDKLLGGPQAGIIIGKKKYIDILKKHPLTRAMRIDKLTLAALEATLRCYAENRQLEAIPTLRMLACSEQELKEKAERLAAMLNESGIRAEAVAVEDQVGGGSVPMQLLKAYAVAVYTDKLTPEQLEKKLRLSEPPIIGRIDHDRYLLHVRTIEQAQFECIASAACAAVAEG